MVQLRNAKAARFGSPESCIPRGDRHPATALPPDHFLLRSPERAARINRLRRRPKWVHLLSATGAAPVRTFTIVGLFFNLSDPTGSKRPGNYATTAASDIDNWLMVGASPTRSTFIGNYWNALSYGKLQVTVDSNRDGAGNYRIPTIAPAADDPQDWGNIAQQIIQVDPQGVWQQAGSILDGSTRVIPSVVVVQNYDTGASALTEWGWTFTQDGSNYRVDDICHISIGDGLDVQAHEHGHNFLNNRDLYGGGGGKIGYWDLLGDALGPSRMSDTSSYFKVALGWVTFNDVIQGPVRAPQEFSLGPYATTGDCYKVVPDPLHNPSEFFLLEFRVSTATDPWTPDGSRIPGGLLITHVNTRLGDWAGVSASSSPLMDVVEADGNDGKCWDDRGICDTPWSDFGGATASDVGASFFPPNNWPDPGRPAGTMYPAGTNQSFTPLTNPSSAFYGGRDTGLSITDIRLDGNTCRFTLRLDGNDQGVVTLDPGWQRQLADFDGDGLDELLVFTGSTLALVDISQNQFHVVWRADNWLGGWHFGPRDRFTIGDFNGDGRADVFVRSDHWAGLFLCDGRSFAQVWMTGDPARGGDWIDGWHLGPQDRTWAGDFDGDGRDDLFVRSPRWAALLRSTGDGFTVAWISGDPDRNENWIGGWHLGPGDQHVVVDFDADGRDDVFVHNGGWAGLLLSNGNGFDEVWMTGDPANNDNWIGGWHVGPDDRYLAGDFDGDGAADLWVHNGGWAALLRSTGRGFEQAWISGNPDDHTNWIDGWHLGPQDRYVVADMNGDGRDDLFVRSDQWAAMLVSDGQSFHVEWMTGDPSQGGNWIGPVPLNDPGDTEHRARLSYLTQVGIFQARADRTTAGFQSILDGQSGKYYFDCSWVGPSEFVTRLPSPPTARFLVGHFTDQAVDTIVVSDGTALALWTGIDGTPSLVGRSGEWIDGWHLGPFDRFTVADLDGDGFDELFVRSPQWAGVLRWNRNAQSFTCPWISGDPSANANWIDGWHLGPLDREVAADVDGDGQVELFVRSPLWAGLFRWDAGSASMRCPWISGDPAANANWIGGWHLGPQDRAVAGRFRGLASDELFFRSPYWAGLVAWNGSAFDTIWMSGGPAANANWIGGWHLGPPDREIAGRFTSDATQLFVHSRRWAGLFEWNARSRTMTCPWMTGDPDANANWIGGWHVGPQDWAVAADVDADGREELVIRSPRWLGLIDALGRGLTSTSVQQGNIGTWMLGVDDRLAAGRFSGREATVFVNHPWGWMATIGVARGPMFNLRSAYFRTLRASA